MNTFGRLFRVSVFGESHGKSVGVLLDGCPVGLSLSEDDFGLDLGRRRGGGVKGTTPRREEDRPFIKSGLFNGKTNGTPLLILFDNADVDPDAYERIKDTPRPGHADLVARQKFAGYADPRGGGHFSGRLTVGLVAAGAVAKKLLKPVSLHARLVQAGGETDVDGAVEKALQEGDSIGGIVECRCTGLPASLGEPFFDSVESLISHAAFSIPAVKAIEFGSGFAVAKMRGSECNDEILDAAGTTRTNHAGGINGGLSNGNELVFRIAVKPTSSIPKAQGTVDLRTGQRASVTVQGRHDACIALRVPVVLEAMTALVMADLMLLEGRMQRVPS